MHFQQFLRETKSKSAKFRIRWSKVPRILGPLNRVTAILVTRPATAGGRFQAEKKTPKMAINRDFPGLRAFSAIFARDKIEEREIPHPMVKSAAHFGAPQPSYGHFSYPAGRSRGKVSSQKNTQNGNKSRFPGATCIFSNFCERQNRRARNSASDGQKCRAFGAPKPSYGHFSYPASHSWGKVSSRKTPKMAINRDFPGLRAFSAIFARDKIEEREIPHPMVKSAAHFGAPKPSYGHFSYPAGHSWGKVSSQKKNTQNGNKSRLPGATCIFSNFCERQNRRARNSASDGQKCRAFWSP